MGKAYAILVKGGRRLYSSVPKKYKQACLDELTKFVENGDLSEEDFEALIAK